MSPKIYTKTGDRGTTLLVGGTRVSKSDARLEAYGTVDELMAFMGHLHDKIELLAANDLNAAVKDRITGSLIEILDRLMSVASLLAAEDQTIKKLPRIEAEDISLLERWTDELLEGLPPLKYFTLPAGNELVSYVHICRTVCRRAERRIVASIEGGNVIHDQVPAYVNRLSDYLYALSRNLAHELKAREVTWEPRTANNN